jgi:S1-C subfamily serine protease
VNSRIGGRAAGVVRVGVFLAAHATNVYAAAPPTCQDTLPAIYDRVSPAVVSIAAMSPESHDVENRFDRVVASGVVIDPSGLIVTNAHVVVGRQVIIVTLDDRSVLPAKLVGADPLFDIALIRITPPAGNPLQAAPLGDSDRIVVGEDVFAIGNPFGLEQTLSRGIVSALNRRLPGLSLSVSEPMIQTDASINPGNSGGPLVNRCGEVVGITTSILPDAQNIGFAVPIDLVKSVTPSLIENGRIVRPWFGVQGELVSAALKDLLRVPLVDGFLVEGVEPGSPADRLGILGGTLEVVIDGQPYLLGGDIVTRIDGVPVKDFDGLTGALRAFKVGGKIRVTLFRNGAVRELACVLTERIPLPPDRAEAYSSLRGDGPKPRPSRGGASYFGVQKF